jgi:hypothetical protein
LDYETTAVQSILGSVLIEISLQKFADATEKTISRPTSFNRDELQMSKPMAVVSKWSRVPIQRGTQGLMGRWNWIIDGVRCVIYKLFWMGGVVWRGCLDEISDKGDDLFCDDSSICGVEVQSIVGESGDCELFHSGTQEQKEVME